MSNRKSDGFYSLSKLGRQKIVTETENWERVATTM
jgi:hypothetical protein